MKKYMLIEVCERDISAIQYDVFEDARQAMMDALEEEFAKSNRDPNDDGETWALIANHDEYCINEDDGFAFGQTWAWSNLDHNYNYDWKIVEIA